MGADPYRRCPGGLDKKIKFCCPDLIQELGKLEKMVESDQVLGSLEFIERLEQKFPGRACLMTQKAMLLDALGKPDEAQETLRRLHESQPENATPLAELAILTAREKDAVEGVKLMQQAVAQSGKSIQATVATFFGEFGRVLLARGHVVSAIQHLLMFQVATQESENRYAEDLSAIFSTPYVPYALKSLPPLRQPPDDAPWKDQADGAVKLARTLRWLKAADQFESLTSEHSDAADLWWNLAVVRGWLANEKGAAEAWRQYSRLSEPHVAAVEAEVTALALSHELEEESVDRIQEVLEFDDYDTVFQRLRSSPRFASLELDWKLLREEGDDSPPPRDGFLILDRDMPSADAELLPEQLPCAKGSVLLYGRETDRRPRAEVLYHRSPLLGLPWADSRELLPDVPLEKVSEEAVGKQAVLSLLMSDRRRCPPDMEPKRAEELRELGMKEQALGLWLEFPFAYLGGRSLRDAARQPDQGIRVEAFLRHLEHVIAPTEGWIDFAAIRSALELPPREKVTVQGDGIASLSPAALLDLEVTGLTDHELSQVYARAEQTGLSRVATKIAQQIVARPDWRGTPSRPVAYEVLSRGEFTGSKAQAYLKAAQRAAEEQGESSAVWDLLEFRLLARHAMIDEAQQVLQHVLDVHSHERGIREAVFSLLVELGLINPDGTPRGRMNVGELDTAPPLAGDAIPSGAPTSGGIWTPDGGAAPREKVSIWTPGD
jgi:hypothetical protein